MLKKILIHLTTLLFFVHLHPNELPRSGFFAQAALLYLQAEEEGLTYAIKSSSPSRINGKAENLIFDWDFGFNVGLGYRIPHDRWQLLLQFTSLQTHCDAEKSGHVFFPSWVISDPSLYATYVKAHWRLHLGLIDLLLIKPWLPTKTLTFTPQMGIRWGSARQKFNLNYRGGNFPDDEGVVIRMKNKYEGLGPYFGLVNEFAMGKGFTLFAQGNVSVLYGEFYLHQDEDTPGIKEKFLGLHSIFRSCSPVLEGTAGIRWQRYFDCSLKRLTLDLAWDQYLFFSQNQLVRFVDNTQHGIVVGNQGDLSVAGARFNFALDF